MLVHRNMKETKKKQKPQADRKSKDDDFQVGDQIYLINNTNQNNKLDKKLLPYYWTLRTSQLCGEGLITKCHALKVRLVDI